jgi:hypothetical protein
MPGKTKVLLEILEKYLPFTGIEHVDDAARASLRQNPEKYKEYLSALDNIGSKEQRAADMGFGDQTFYHGTRSDISSFDKSKRGSSTQAASAKKGFFFAEQPELAADYADNAPNPTGLKTIYDPRFIAAAEDGWPSAKLIEDLNTEGQQILPVKLRTSGALEHDFKGEIYRDKSYSDLLSEANGRGVVLKNARDPVYNTNDVAQTIVGIQDPTAIRSVNAAFDPRFKGSSNILAGVGAIPAVDMSPLPKLGDAVSYYKKLKDNVYGALAKQLNLSKSKAGEEDIKVWLSMAADPLNLVSGVGGFVAPVMEEVLARQGHKNVP